MIGLGAIPFTISGVTRLPLDSPKKTSAPTRASVSVRALVFEAKRALYGVHALGAALVDHALGVAHDDVLDADAEVARSARRRRWRWRRRR